MRIIEDRAWAGSETSLKAALDAEEGLAARIKAGVFDEEDDEEDEKEDELPRLLEIDAESGLATVSIKGPLVNSDSPYLRYFGIVGYPEIRDAVLAAANSADVSSILLDIDSGGGAVSGVDDMAKLIRLVNDKVKPVSTFTDGTMASAAYWLGSSAGEVYSGKAALVGSIGVIATHREYSEAYKQEGVGVTVVRAGKYKALANSNEKLTPEGRAQIQKIVDASYQVFVEHVADVRGKSYEYADKTMADGQEFIGQAAADVGLTDGITTYDSLVSDLKEKAIARLHNSMDNGSSHSNRLSGSTDHVLSGESEMPKKALTEADIAALAAGASAVAAAKVEGVDPPVEQEPTQAEAVVDAKIEENVTAVVEEPVKSDATVQYLSAQVKEKDAELLAANIKLAKLEDRLAELDAVLIPLTDIAAKSVSNMAVAMGGSAYLAEGLTATQVLAEHTRVSAAFKSKFKVGGVAAVSADSTDDTASKGRNVMDNMTQAQVNAVRGVS